MVKMTISQDAINFLKNRGYDKHEIILIVVAVIIQLKVDLAILAWITL